MSLLTALDINSSGLTAQRQRAEVTSNNIANAQTTRTPEGGPFRRKDVVFQTLLNGAENGVEVSDIVEDQTAFDRRYEPGHPDADGQGYVSYPNVNPMEEMANLVEASRTYDANISAMNVVKSMISKTMELGK
jgi:flagellar basal-body rod protein FlgC